MLANIIRNAKKTVGGGGGGIVIDNGDPFYSAVSLLLPMDGTNGSTTFTDSGPNALTVTPSGNTQLKSTVSKFGGSSAYFDGTGDYLSVAANAAIELSSSDFTIEFWIRPAPKTNAVDAAFGYSNYACMFYHNGVNWTLELSSTGVSNQLVISSPVTLNNWQHIAIVRYGNSIVVYKDGVSSATGTFSGTVATSGRTLRIGDNGNSQNINGYIDDFRISRFARYVSNFTPPTSALPTTASSTPADPYYGYTSLLLHMDGSSGSTNFVDSGPNALVVTAAGNAQISTSQSKYGGASGAFDGAGDYLSVASNPLFNFGTGDFTMELWAKLPNDNVDYSLVSGSANGNMDFRRESTGRLSLGRAAVVWDANSSVINIANQWTHLAASRSGSTLRLFCNGIQIYSGSNSVSYSVANLQMGRSTGVSAVDLNGFIDDLRITKGVARYTSNFTPPTAEFPNA